MLVSPTPWMKGREVEISPRTRAYRQRAEFEGEGDARDFLSSRASEGKIGALTPCSASPTG